MAKEISDPKELYSEIIFNNSCNSYSLPFCGTIKKSPSALQKAQLSIDLLAVYLHMISYGIQIPNTVASFLTIKLSSIH